MKQAGKQLNLASHVVGKNGTKIFGPGDIEGHLGTDGKFYVIDFGYVREDYGKEGEAS
jgi:hypothetical protein